MNHILITIIAVAVCAVCIIFFCIGQGISWFQACGGSVSEVSLLFIDPTGQEPLPESIQSGGRRRAIMGISKYNGRGRSGQPAKTPSSVCGGNKNF